MAKKAEENLSKHTLNLYEGDYSRIQELYPEMGAGAIIRRLVRDFITRIESAKPTTSIKESIKL